jgi:hypothetical protein
MYIFDSLSGNSLALPFLITKDMANELAVPFPDCAMGETALYVQ